MLSSSRPTELVYDFGGFDPMYFRMRYDTPAATDLGRPGRRAACPTPSRCTSTAAAAWTTARGCR